MSIFDDFFFNAKSAVNAVGKKAEKVIDVSKLKYAEAGLQSEINKKYQELGRFVYDSYLSGEMDKDALSGKIDELQELNENLEATRELINAQKNKVKCKSCGGVVSADLQYCGDDPSNTAPEINDDDDPVAREAQQAVRDARE